MLTVDSLGVVLIGIAIAVGMVGIVVPIFPGLSLVAGAVLVWAFFEDGVLAWVVALVSVALAGVGTFLKYQIPRRQLVRTGVPKRTLVVAALVGIIGFFAVPVIGAPIGFVATIYVFEWLRLRPEPAWPATKTALEAIATSIGVELVTGVMIFLLWIGAVLFS